MEVSKLQAWWAHRQCLDGSLRGTSPAEVLQRTGWARSVGGVGPYLTLFSRAGVSRAAADAAAAKLQIHELPSARGCTYVLPASDFALGLKVGETFGGGEMRVAEKLGVTSREIDRLCKKVLDALANGPMDPEELRKATGDASRSLGDEGKKKGLTTTLPVALGKLQTTADIRRVPINGRLDQQRYKYTLWKPNPLAKLAMTRQEAYTALARRFFTWIGPARPAEFQAFAGLGVKATRDAMAPLKLAEAPDNEGRMMLAEDLDDYRAFKVPKSPQYAMVSGLDGLALLRRDMKSLISAKNASRKVFNETSLEPLSGLADLPSHGIFDRGTLIGLWEFDLETGTIAWMTFAPASRELAQLAKTTEAFVRDDLGDARSFSLDSPKSRAPRVEAIRKVGGKT